MKYLVAILVFLGSVSHGYAQQMGIAAFQAPEAGGGICFGQDGEKVIACARQKCIVNSGLEAEDCMPTLWCFPMGWTGDIFLQSSEGIHWHEFVCGQTSRAALERAVAERCADEGLIGCLMVQMWTPAGKEVAL